MASFASARARSRSTSNRLAATLAVVVTGDLASQAGELLGLHDTAVTVWNFAKWPVASVLVALLLSPTLLYRAAPNVRHPGSAG